LLLKERDFRFDNRLTSGNGPVKLLFDICKVFNLVRLPR
jgi:hypothetical protein